MALARWTQTQVLFPIQYGSFQFFADVLATDHFPGPPPRGSIYWEKEVDHKTEPSDL